MSSRWKSRDGHSAQPLTRNMPFQKRLYFQAEINCGRRICESRVDTERNAGGRHFVCTKLSVDQFGSNGGEVCNNGIESIEIRYWPLKTISLCRIAYFWKHEIKNEVAGDIVHMGRAVRGSRHRLHNKANLR